MKIHVVGHCQAIPLAACIAVMNPGVRVERYALGAGPEDVADGDVVFRQRDRSTRWNAGERQPGEILYPRIVFNAFHPDAIYVRGPDGPVPTPMGEYHSSLVVYAWHRGLSPAETANLFTEAVFEKLGFFDCWDAAARVLFEEGRSIDFPLETAFAAWRRRGCFMHTSHHPVLSVIADVARALMRRAGLTPAFDVPESYLSDPLLDEGVWPVYPEVGSRLGVPGAYAFKPSHPAGEPVPLILDLDEFIARSFIAYAHMPAEALASPRLNTERYRDLERAAARTRAEPRASAAPEPGSATRHRAESPYADLPPINFWRRAIERVSARDVDPAGDPPFRIDRHTRIATAGSCFAQHMSRVLRRAGYNYFVAEDAPDELSPEEARRAGYGIFSTRCGNVYTARQLLQLFDRAYGSLTPGDVAWLRPDGRFADPFRAQIDPAGFASVEELVASRERHFAAVRTMFAQLDVLIFTLGQTEAWRSAADGAVFSSAPGVVAGRMDRSRYEFVNFTAADVEDDLHGLVARLGGVNPGANIVLTVSPQPLIATYEARHVLQSATYSKAALRTAADAVERAHAGVWYFPAFEVVAGSFNRGAYYEPDRRTVTEEGVQHVMRLFFAHCDGVAEQRPDTDAMLEERRETMDVVCDEEALAYDGASGAAEWPEHAIFLARAEPPRRHGGGARPSAGTMDALHPSSMRARLDAVLPKAMAARSAVAAAGTVANDGDVALVTAGDYPVYACYRWYDESGALTDAGEWIHTPLPAPIAPGASADVLIRIAAPRYPGRFRLRVTLLQSDVAWFDDVDPRNGVETVVDVSGGTAARAHGPGAEKPAAARNVTTAR